MSRFTTCGLTILLAFAPAALAVDGTVLINQSTITNGLPGCPTGGHFPIIICQSGSYRLSSNLTVPNTTTGAIDITADNVTIDLNGFSILGPTVCSGSPLTCSPNNGTSSGNGISSSNANIVVMNGQIKGMGINGISLTGTKSRVQNIQATSNFNHGIFVGDSSLVSSCTVNSNGGAGIFANGSDVVTGNLVSFNFNGIISGNQAALISNNSVVSSLSVGIQVVCPSLISGNLVFLNANNSQLFDASGNLLATGNLVALGSSVFGCVLVNNAP
jgi:hypothetical protein